MMFISVDLPDPDGAHDRDELAALDRQRDAAQRVHLDVADRVASSTISRSSMTVTGRGRGASGLLRAPVVSATPLMVHPARRREAAAAEDGVDDGRRRRR